MPAELEDHLKVTGCILWEEFTKTAVNKFDVQGVLSANLGSFETGLTVLPEVGTFYVNPNDEESPGLFRH